MSSEQPLTNQVAWRIYGELVHNIGNAVLRGVVGFAIALVAVILIGMWRLWVGIVLSGVPVIVGVIVTARWLRDHGTDLATRASRGQDIN